MAVWYERQNKVIHNLAVILKEKMMGGMIFGLPFDPNNPDHLVVAAYYYEIAEESKIHIERTRRVKEDAE